MVRDNEGVERGEVSMELKRTRVLEREKERVNDKEIGVMMRRRKEDENEG